jgi:hypothetical protein
LSNLVIRRPAAWSFNEESSTFGINDGTTAILRLSNLLLLVRLLGRSPCGQEDQDRECNQMPQSDVKPNISNRLYYLDRKVTKGLAVVPPRGNSSRRRVRHIAVLPILDSQFKL